MSKSSDIFFQYLDKPLEVTKQSWPSSIKPLVSISCTAFNQENFIEECIEGFLLQKTTFPIEIIIYDDASTDCTAEKIKTYQNKYPWLIKGNLQSENQFRKGENVNIFNFKKVKGSFVALCHGDDYWSDPDKLQKQIEAMFLFQAEISGHPAKCIDTKGNQTGKIVGFRAERLEHFPPSFLIKMNGNIFPFGSIVLTKRAVKRLIDHMPPVQFHTGIQLLGAYDRGALILPDVMSVYRVEVPGSTTEILLNDYKKVLQTTRKRIESLKFLKRLYGSAYETEFNQLLASQILYSKSTGMKSVLVLIKDLMRNEKFKIRVVLFPLIIIEIFKALIKLPMKLMVGFIKKKK